MCGFVGFCSKNVKDKNVIKEMNSQIIHRGPDSDGYDFDKGINFGFRRLSIIDLHEGSQPILNENNDVAIIVNGEIYNYHNPNEKYWKVEDGCLKIYNENQELILEQETVSYTNTHQKSIKQISLNFLFGKDKHYLDFLRIKDTSRTVKPLNFLNIDACFSNRSDTLLVIFNSAGGEYNGQTVFHEFYHTPYQFAVDYIRISQSKPTRVYLDSYQKIEALVNINNYKKIVFLGMSIGGYAALWFAETIARKNPLTDYCSIAIQPLTSLKQDFA